MAGARRASSAQSRFLYLIEEYEPLLAPVGSYAALAEQSYGFPHQALFSSEPLRDYFRRHRIGVFAGSAVWGSAIARLPGRDRCR